MEREELIIFLRENFKIEVTTGNCNDKIEVNLFFSGEEIASDYIFLDSLGFEYRK